MKNWPRKRKLALAMLILLVSVAVILSICEWRSPTLEIAIRRMAKRMLIGPAETITTMDFAYSPWDHLVIGKTEYGYTTYEYRDDLGWDNGNLRYFERTAKATLFCTDYRYRINEEEILPIFLFPEKQQSAKANMTLTITSDTGSGTYQLIGQKPDSSFYMFFLPTKELDGQFFWLLQQALTGAYSEYVLTGSVEIKIDYFDLSGNLIDTYAKTVTK